MDRDHTNHDHGSTATPSSPSLSRVQYAHMTFFWGSHAEILFSGWPGSRSGTYVLALVVVFALSVVLEWFNNRNAVTEKLGRSGVALELARTLVHGVRAGVAYLIMLAVMSFNVGVLLAAISGHALGFFLFGTKGGRHGDEECGEKKPELPPVAC